MITLQDAEHLADARADMPAGGAYCARPLDAHARLTLQMTVWALSLVFDVRGPQFRPK
jgi:hypothetical protein